MAVPFFNGLEIKVRNLTTRIVQDTNLRVSNIVLWEVHSTLLKGLSKNRGTNRNKKGLRFVAWSPRLSPWLLWRLCCMAPGCAVSCRLLAVPVSVALSGCAVAAGPCLVACSPRLSPSVRGLPGS